MSTYLICILVFMLLLILSGGIGYVTKKRKKTKQQVGGIIVEICKALDDYDILLGDCYCAHSAMETYKEKYAQLYTDSEHIPYYLIGFEEELKHIETIRLFHRQYTEIEKTAKLHNEHWTEGQLALHQTYFDTLFNYPLDEQQRRAILSLEDNTQVVASAGSGKTSTIMGRTRYLVDKVGVKPRQILLVTYTRKAAEEMRSRLHIDGIKACTFHSLALDIIAQSTGKKPSIAKESLVQEVMYDLLKQKDYQRAVIDYVMLYKNLIEKEHDYETPAALFADRKKYGFQADFPDMDGHFIYTKSEQERQLCNLLAIWGIKFRYEEQYEIDVADTERRQYKPDFSIYYKDKDGQQKRLYLEHFAISHGHVPKYFGQQVGKEFNETKWKEQDERYRKGIVWKRQIHKVNHTDLIETTSEDFYSGELKMRLQERLIPYGIKSKGLEVGATYAGLIERNKLLEKQLMEMVEAFIILMKANRKTIPSIIKESGSARTAFMLEDLVKPVYTEYEKRLKERNEIDFTDAILMATKAIEEGFATPWTDILVDEFQDISMDRYWLLKQLHKEGTRLFCVGDDWQSIYRFSGSDMGLMNQFSKWFGYTEQRKIESTHRFGNPAVQMSSLFVMKNKEQLRKDVQCDEGRVTDIQFVGYDEKQPEYWRISQLIQTIPEEESIYILSRYNSDVEALDQGKNVTYDLHHNSITIQIGGRTVPFLTIHSAKGLEADNVIVLNCNASRFPSQIADDPVLNHVLSEKEPYPDAEERRLFYVAITRAKKHTYVLYDVDDRSPFVSEFVGKANADREICPICGLGYVVTRKTGVASNGNPYQVVGCSNVKMRCWFFETRFENYNEQEHRDKFAHYPEQRFRTRNARKIGEDNI